MAARLSLSERYVLDLLNRGEFRERRIGRRRLIYTASVLEWLAQSDGTA